MNKKGFALVELLVVMVVLSIISLVAVPAVIDVIDDSKEKVYQEQEDSIEDAARNYMAKHSVDLPKINGESKCITVSELKDAGLLTDKTIKNPVGSNYKDYAEKDDNFNGGVLISYNNSKYTYTYVNDCGAMPFTGKVYAINDRKHTPGKNTIYKGTSKLSDIDKTYDSCQAAGKDVCLKYSIENDIVVGADVCFVKDGTEYCLIGWDDGANWQSGIDMLQTIFEGTNYCKLQSSGKNYMCYGGGWNIQTFSQGSVSARNFNTNWYCIASSASTYAYCETSTY